MNTVPQRGESYYTVRNEDYVVGLCVRRGKVKFAPPVIGWCVGWREGRALQYFRKIGYRVKKLKRGG